MKRFLIVLLAMLLALSALPVLSEEVSAEYADAAVAELNDVAIGASEALGAPAEAEYVALPVSKKATKTVYLGLVYRIIPDVPVKSCKSSAKKVAAVDSAGVVTPKKSGTAKITVTLTNKKKFVLTLKVVDPTAPTKVTLLEGKKGSVTAGGTLRLTAVVSPSTASQVVKWKSSKTSVATVDAAGLVTAKKAGTAKITATAGKKSATFTVTVKKAPVVRMDLFPYLRTPMLQTAKALGLKEKKPFKSDVGGWELTYANSYFSVTLHNEDCNEDPIPIDIIDLNSDPKGLYSMDGLTIGMKKADADALLAEKGWSYASGYDYTYKKVTYYRYTRGRYSLRLGYKSGKIVSISADYSPW